MSRVLGSPLNLLVTWTSPSEPNGVIESYTVHCYKPILDLGNGTQQYSGGMRQPDIHDESMYARTIVPGNETQAIVTDLEPYTTYNCYVVANTSAGAGDPSFAHSVTTDESGECLPFFNNFFMVLPGMTQLMRKSLIALSLILRGSRGPTA